MENNDTTTFLPPVPINPARNALKAILLLTLFFTTFLAGVAAFVLKRFVLRHRQQSPIFHHLFSAVSCFGAGVFLATCLLDLLPDAVESVNKAEKHMGKQIDFPIPELCVSIGFLLVLILEQAIVYANERNWIGTSEMQHLLSHHDSANLPGSAVSITNRFSYVGRHHSPINEEVDVRHDFVNDEDEGDTHFNPDSHSTIRALLLVFALSLHAVFEGLSVGMISDVSVLLQIFAALLIHKTVISFSLGVRLVQSRLRTFTIILCCIVFASQVLIGGFTGLAIMDMLHSGSAGSAYLVAGILQAIACGTFLYITAFEILPHELNEKGHRPMKMLFLLCGFALITFFIYMFPDDDNN